MEEVLFRVGGELGRTKEEIEPIIKLFQENWINSLEIWQQLPVESKKEFKLPLMLELRLNKLSEKEVVKEEPVCKSKIAGIEANGSQLGVELGSGMFICSFGDLIIPIDMDEPLSSLLHRLSSSGEATFYRPVKQLDGEENKNDGQEKENEKEGGGEVEECTQGGIDLRNYVPIQTDVALTFVLISDNVFKLRDKIYKINRKPEPQFNCVEKWLRLHGLEKLINLFARYKMDDYFSLIFLRKSVLELMGLKPGEPDSDGAKILAVINKWLHFSEYEFVGQWLEVLGFPQYAKKFIEEEVSLATICVAFEEESDLEAVGVDNKEDRKKMLDCFHRYKNFSSVEETFTWLRSNGFQKYSFHFARYNIPFYALPFVNFFIIDEMGVTHDDQILLDALQELKSSPAYLVKAMAYWLRDLEMERYNRRFASEAIADLEVLTLLEDRHIDDLIASTSDSRKMKEALKEMKEFQYHYSATAALLSELGMDRYAQLFALHGISVGVLPLLKEKQLVEMGITDETDRKKVMRAIDKIKNHLPSGVASWLADYHKPISTESPRGSPTPERASPFGPGKKAKQKERRRRKARAMAAVKKAQAGGS